MTLFVFLFVCCLALTTSQLSSHWEQYNEDALEAGVWCADQYVQYKNGIQLGDIPPPFRLNPNSMGKDDNLKVLFFAGLEHLDLFSDRHFFHLVCAAASDTRLPVSAYVWGWRWFLGRYSPIWFKHDLSFEANVERVFKDKDFFDVVVTTWQPNSYISKEKAFNGTYGNRTTAVVYLHEYRQTTENYFEKSINRLRRQFQVVLGSYLEDMLSLIIKAGEQIQKKVLFSLWEHTGGVSPDLVAAYRLAAKNWSQEQVETFMQDDLSCPYNAENIDHGRSKDVCLIGTTGHLYPFRNKMRSFFDSNNQTGMFHIAGKYSVKDENHGPRIRHAELANAHYLNVIRNCKITVLTGGNNYMMLRKYFEASRWGSVMMGTVPYRLYANFQTKETVIPLPLFQALGNESDKRALTLSHFQYWIGRPRLRAEQACRAFAVLGRRTDQTAFHELIYHTLNYRENGIRGLVYTHSPIINTTILLQQ